MSKKGVEKIGKLLHCKRRYNLSWAQPKLPSLMPPEDGGSEGSIVNPIPVGYLRINNNP